MSNIILNEGYKNLNVIFERGNVESLSKSVKFIYDNEYIYQSLSHNSRMFAEKYLDINLRIDDYIKYCSKLQ